MEAEIIQAIHTIFEGVDERNRPKVQVIMAEQVMLDYTSLNGGEPNQQTPQEITAIWATFLPGFDKTHHQISDFRVTITGNQAVAHYQGKGNHFLNNEVWTAEGTFNTALEQQDHKWLVTQHKFNLIKQSGNQELPAQAKAVLEKKAAL
ncbi:nuclear transport factor 2 family protein [Adhaeribacter arboris]|nr:nuclear transport factor 2 family protein [Adhaeribacter arboris]